MLALRGSYLCCTQLTVNPTFLIRSPPIPRIRILYPDGKRNETNAFFFVNPNGKRNKTKLVLPIRMANAITLLLFLIRKADAIKPTFLLRIQRQTQ